MGSIFGEKVDPIRSPDYMRLDGLADTLANQYNNNASWNADKLTAGQFAFQNMGKDALANTMTGINSQRGIRASQGATMANNALSNQQSQLAGQSAIRDAMEREAAQNQLMSIEMGKIGQQIDIDKANAQIQQQNNEAMDRLIGTGLTAAGYAFGGPAGGMAAQGLYSQAAGGGGGMTSTSPNPYAAAPVSTGNMSYNPSRYNMGQALRY